MQLLFMPFCCLCNKLARHWFVPKIRHANCVGLLRNTPGSCRARSPALRVGGRDRVASWSWSCTQSHPHAHLHAPVYAVYVYAVYAISSLDTSSPLRHRTRQRRRGTLGSCRARSPALLVGGRDRVASCVHVHRTRMLICMHIWGSSLHLPPHRRSSIIVIGICTYSRSRAPRGCCHPPVFRRTGDRLPRASARKARAVRASFRRPAGWSLSRVAQAPLGAPFVPASAVSPCRLGLLFMLFMQ